MNLGQATTGVVLTAAAPTVLQTFNLEMYIGVEGNVLIAVIVGALCAIVFVKGKEPRKDLYLVALGSVLIGCAVTSLISLVVHKMYGVTMQPKHMASVGIIVGALLRFVIPPFIERIPGWLDRIPFFSKK